MLERRLRRWLHIFETTQYTPIGTVEPGGKRQCAKYGSRKQDPAQEFRPDCHRPECEADTGWNQLEKAKDPQQKRPSTWLFRHAGHAGWHDKDRTQGS